MNIEDLLQDAEFTKQVENAERLDDVVELLNKKGFEVTAEDLTNALKAANGELSEENLEDVAGGTSLAIKAGVIAGKAVGYWIKKYGRNLPRWLII